MSPCILESDISSESVAPIEPDATQSSDCVVLIDDDDDDDDQEGDETQPEQPTFAHSTSLNDFCAPSPPAAVTDEQPAELPPEALDSGPTNLFVDLAASSDEEPDVTMASTPPLSNPQPSAAPTPSSISPTTTESCGLPAVIPSPSLARLSVDIAPLLHVSSQPLNLTSHAAQPLPPSPAADAAVVNAAGTSSTPQASPPPNKAIGLFVDLAASSDEEPYVTMASTPPLSNPQPSAAATPSSISPTTTESCNLPAVIPSPSLAPIPSVLPRPLNLVGNSTQPVPPLSAADAAVASAAGTSSTPQESLPPNKSNKATG
nr:unnamed protein product [Spirometra erinaceieuropaei]